MCVSKNTLCTIYSLLRILYWSSIRWNWRLDTHILPLEQKDAHCIFTQCVAVNQLYKTLLLTKHCLVSSIVEFIHSLTMHFVFLVVVLGQGQAFKAHTKPALHWQLPHVSLSSIHHLAHWEPLEVNMSIHRIAYRLGQVVCIWYFE